jgi:hypothetical protein
MKLDFQRSGQQNKMFHAILGQIAKQATHLGSKWTTEDWKRLLLYHWHRERGERPSQLIKALDGEGIVQLGLQSSKLTKEECAEFTEFLLAWSAQNGITINEVPKTPIRPQQGAFRSR